MKIKTGIDIIEIDRIKSSIEKFGDNFLNRVFTPNEIEYCEKKNTQKFQSYAGKFAAKEAVFKAFSQCLNNKFDIQWKDIEILNDENGRPFVKFYGEFEKIELLYKQENNINHCFEIDISISHIAKTAVASVVISL